MTAPLRIAITIFPEAMALDWVGPLDILNTLSRDESSKPSTIPSVKLVIVGDSLAPIRQSNGMMVTPEITFEDAKTQEWDAVLIPGGQGARPWFESNKGCRDFLMEVVPKARFVFTGISHLI
jgi:cyclohexyl-isocyanide hydratase